ncbi:polyamine aminopropyltransferase [Pseudomonadota bacterium]
MVLVVRVVALALESSLSIDVALEAKNKSDKTYVTTLVYTAFIAGLCSIIYELLIATTVSYFLGDSVKYFSITIGVYMAAMGVGSYVSKYIDERILERFVVIELWLGLLGGLSIPALYFSYAYTAAFMPVYLFFTIAIGFLIGLEIPFLTRLMETYNQLKINIANILSFDYLGALIATLAFPFLLLPLFGVYQSSLIFGLINMSIGFVVLHIFSNEIGDKSRRLKKITYLLTAVLVVMIVFSGAALNHWDSALYEDRVVYSEQTRYQKIVLTKDRDDVRLFLDGNLQFSSVDEYRYHEALIHVPMSATKHPVKRVLLLGAGDGLAIRELLKYSEIEEIVLVDLDEAIIDLASSNSYFTSLNEESMASEKVTVVVSDAFTYLRENNSPFDFIISDLPDPNNNALARLYSKQFYKLLNMNISHSGMFVTQATSPYFATQAYWSIVKTIQAGGFNNTYPYHASVPSFGEWGFVLASNELLDVQSARLDVATKFLTDSNLLTLFVFDKDIQARDVEVNMLDKPILLSYYLKGWEYYAR